MRRNPFTWSAAVAAVLLFTLGCGPAEPPAVTSVLTPSPAGDCLTLPSGSRLPRFGVGEGRLILSYVVSDTATGDRLFAREWSATGWGRDTLVAGGTDWFVNWADFPSVKPFGDSLFYHYLAYSGVGTYDYDVRFSVGAAGPRVLHNDGVPAEHGFVSSALNTDGSLQVAWLDGRNTKTDPEPATGHDHHAAGGAMTLRTARVLPDGTVAERTELDGRVCDCCSTATVTTPGRTMVAYRDRSDSEVRDIYFTQREGGGSWTAPRAVHADGWEITGCPVNGPALAANGAGEVVVAWYTAAQDDTRIQLARYDTLAAAFGAPVVLDHQDPLGRIDVRLADDGTAYVLGLAATEDPDVAAVTLYTVTPAGEVGRRELARSSSARGTGFPRLVLREGRMFYAYTQLEGGEPVVRVCGVDSR